jgi:K+-transporting ATPase A subunit
LRRSPRDSSSTSTIEAARRGRTPTRDNAAVIGKPVAAVLALLAAVGFGLVGVGLALVLLLIIAVVAIGATRIGRRDDRR